MKRSVCILLSLMLALTGLVGLGMTSSAVYKVGSTYTFGSYPQTEVTASLGSTLNAMGGAWTSYNYGTVNGNDCMQYKDVMYNGAKYRGVTITENRPIGGSYSNTQRDNGYIKGTVYWFMWEPLQWRVLDPSAGFLLCESIIDSQPFQSNLSSSHDESGQTIYPCDYSNSNIRTWLNQDFINTAFSSTEKAAIQTTTLDNKSALSSLYDAKTTNDKVFLLSYAEATNSAYGFRSDPENEELKNTDLIKLMEGSDYAKCQGLWYCQDAYSLFENYSYWWLRTPYSPVYACGVEYDGRAFTNELVTHTNYGVCPAIKIGNLNAGLTLKSIAVKTMPSKTVYTIGESFSQSGLTLTATYSDGSTETITSGFNCTGFSSATAGTKTVTVTYEGKTTTFTVTVNSGTATLSGITVKTMPAKMSYFVGENFNPSGLTLTAKYSDGSTKTIESGFSCTGFSSAAPGISTITVKYEGKTTTFDVTINPAPADLSGITVKTLPAKTVYKIGESFDQSGLTLTLTYSNGKTDTITEGFTCSGFSSSTSGVKTIRVNYKGLSATFEVTVVSDGSEPVIAIHNYTAERTVDYKTTITFSVDKVQNPVSGAEVHWFIDDQDKGTGDTYTVTRATKAFTVQAKYMKDGSTLALSAKETVNVKSGFFARLKAFFRGLFGKLPVVVQEVFGFEILDRILPD